MTYYGDEMDVRWTDPDDGDEDVHTHNPDIPPEYDEDPAVDVPDLPDTLREQRELS